MNTASRLLCAGLALAGVLSIVAEANAQGRRYGELDYRGPDRSITVTRRSFLDSGTVVPVGSRNQYVQEILRFERPPLANTSPGILWRPDPGSPEPIF